jgi:hypothetical protein
MPGVHRQDDSRFCGATTIVTGQSTVYVEGKLVAVEGDMNSHGGGALQSVYGDGSVTIENKKIIVAVGDKAAGDNKKHPAPPTDPKGHSSTVIVYGGAAGGG